MNYNQDIDHEKELIFVFPYNYNDRQKFMGRFAWSGVCLAVAWIAFVIFMFYVFQIGIGIAIYLFIFIGPLPALLLIVGINGDPTISFIKYVLKFAKTSKLYLYRKN